MTNGRPVVLRRTWPQRLMILASLAVIVAAWYLARTVEHITEVVEDITRVEIIDRGQYGRQLLVTDTDPADPVTLLLVGTDSALGLDPDDPVLEGRVVDETGRSLADTIMLVRVDPVSGSAWTLPIPRDLWAEIPGAQDNKITSALYIGGAELLVATVTSMFDVEINHYIELDLAGFQAVVDTLGGIPVWFPNPVRDAGSGLNIPTPGCHTLNGERALQYVRSRRYTEQIDGRWRITGGDDFSRIKRQQDFLVLALDRAIERGGRNPNTLIDLLEAVASSMTLDQDLTVGELAALARGFADFNPDNLQRLGLNLYTVWWPDGTYKGEAAYRDSNRPILDIFRGGADAVRPSDVSVTVLGPAEASRRDASTLLAAEGFVASASAIAAQIDETVVLHGPGARNAAVSVARYLEPVPYVLEIGGLDRVLVVLGDDYEGVNFLFQEAFADVESAVAARGVAPVPPDVLALAVSRALEPSGAQASTTVTPPSPPPTVAVAEVSQVAAPEAEDAATESAILGRPPEGESCG